MNKVIIMGRLTADPDLRTTQTGMSTCRFSVAVDRPFIDKTTGQRQADFIRCTAWDKSAENINRFFRKGSMIMIEGSLRTGSYQDKQYQDVTHYTTDVFVDRWEFCGSKADSAVNGGNAYSAPRNNYQAPPQQAPASVSQQPAQNNENMSYGTYNDFEEILGDSDIPF